MYLKESNVGCDAGGTTGKEELCWRSGMVTALAV